MTGNPTILCFLCFWTIFPVAVAKCLCGAFLTVRIQTRLENFLTQQVDFPEDIIMSPNHRELLCPVGCVDEDAVAIVSLSSETIRFYTYLPHGVDFLIGWWPNSRGWLYRDAYNRIYLVSVTKGGPQKVSYLLRDDASPKWKALSEASVQEQFQVLPKATKYLLKAAVYNLPHEDTCNGNGGHLIYFVWYPLCQRLYGHGATRSRLIDLGKSWCALEISLSPDGKYVALLVEKNEQSSYPSLWRVLVGKTSEGVMHSVGSWRGNLYPYHNMEGGSVLRWSLDGKHLGVLLEDKRDNGVALYILNVPKSS